MTEREFRLASGHVIRSGIARFVALLGVTGISTFVAVYALGKIGGDVLADALLGFGLGPMPFIFYQWRESRARVVVEPQGIRWKSSATTMTLAWRHITSVRARTNSPHSCISRLLAGGHPEHVEVKLSRRPRVRFWTPGTSGTDIFGWPAGPKTFRLHVQDPEGFLRAAEPFLNDQSVSGHRPSA